MVFSPLTPPRVTIAADGTRAAILERSLITIVELPTASPIAELGIDPAASACEVGWVGSPPRLLVLTRFAAHSIVQLVELAPHATRTLAEIRLEAPMRLHATVHGFALAVGALGVAVLATGDTYITPYQFPARTLPVAAGAAGNQFVVALAGSIEEWDPASRTPKRRLRLPRPAHITAIGGSERVVWMTTQHEPKRIEVIPLVNRGQPKAWDLPEPLAQVTGHPASDLLACVGGETGKIYLVDLDGRTPIRLLRVDPINRADAVGFVHARTSFVLAAQAERPLVAVTIHGAPVKPEVAVPTVGTLSTNSTSSPSPGAHAASSVDRRDLRDPHDAPDAIHARDVPTRDARDVPEPGDALHARDPESRGANASELEDALEEPAPRPSTLFDPPAPSIATVTRPDASSSPARAGAPSPVAPPAHPPVPIVPVTTLAPPVPAVPIVVSTLAPSPHAATRPPASVGSRPVFTRPTAIAPVARELAVDTTPAGRSLTDRFADRRERLRDAQALPANPPASLAIHDAIGPAATPAVPVARADAIGPASTPAVAVARADAIGPASTPAVAVARADAIRPAFAVAVARATITSPEPTWRDVVVAWTRAVARTPSEAAIPQLPATLELAPFDALVERFDLAAELRLALVLAYGSHLCGEGGAAPFELSRVIGDRWDEVLRADGALARRGLVEPHGARVRLARPILRLLDELGPIGELVGDPGEIVLLGPCVVIATDASLVAIAERYVGSVGGAILVGDGPDAREILVEACARGAIPLVRAADLAEFPVTPAILVVPDESAAARIELPRL